MQYCNFLLKKRVANNLFISVVEERSGDFGYIITHFIALNVFILAAQTPSQGKLFFFSVVNMIIYFIAQIRIKFYIINEHLYAVCRIP